MKATEREARLVAAGAFAYRARLGEDGLCVSTRPCAKRGDAPAMLRAVARPLVIRGTGWYLLLDKSSGERVGAAEWCGGQLHVYGPPWTWRGRSPIGKVEKRIGVFRSRAAWARLLMRLGDELRDDESPSAALARVEKSSRFPGLVK